VRFASEPFEMEKRAFKIGSLLITRADNEQLAENFETKILELANQLEQKIMPVFSAQVKKGKDLGSPSFKLIEKPKVAAIIGQKVTPTSLGEFWHYFDQELQFPISLLHADNLKEVNLNNYDVVFLASGNYTSQKLANQLLDFVSDGGKLIAVRKALKLLSGRVPTALKQKKEVYGNNKNSETFINSKRSKLSKRITGSVYKINLDPTHYLSSGLTTNFYMLKINNVAYQYLKDDDAYSIGTIKENAAVSGFVGQKVKSKLENSLEIGIEKYGKGTIIYIADSPIIRGFWQSGKLLIANAVFFE